MLGGGGVCFCLGFFLCFVVVFFRLLNKNIKYWSIQCHVLDDLSGWHVVSGSQHARLGERDLIMSLHSLAIFTTLERLHVLSPLTK